LLLDLLDLLLERLNVFGHHDVLQVNTGSHLIEHVNGLVGQETIGDVAVAELHTGNDGLVAVRHIVELLVFGLDVAEDMHRFILGWRIHHHLLETAVERAVFLDVLTILVERGSTDALEFAACEGGLEDIGGVERARSPAGTHHGVYLVNKENHIAVTLQLGHDSLDTLLKLTAILGARNQGSEIEHHKALVEQRAADFLLLDTQCKTFHDGRFTHAGLANQDRVVLLPATEDLADALDFALAADNRVEFALLGQLGDVATEVVEYRRFALVLGLLARLEAATALFIFLVIAGALSLRVKVRVGEVLFRPHILQLLLERIVIHIELIENTGGSSIRVLQERHHEVLGMHLLTLHHLGLHESSFEHPLSLGGHSTIADVQIVGRRIGTVSGYNLFDAFFQIVQINQKRVEYTNRQTVALGDNTQQQVFGTHVIMTQAACFHTALRNDIFYYPGEFFVHCVKKNW